MGLFRQTSDSFLKYATAISVATITLLTLLAAGLFYLQGEASNSAKGWVVHTYQVTGHMQLLFNRIKDVELGQRGYLMTGDEKYLAPYHDALKNSLGADATSTRLEQHHSIAEELAILKKITDDNPTQMQNFEELCIDVQELLDYWASTMHVQPIEKKMAPTLDFQHGEQLMDRVRGIIGIMMADENRLLTSRIEVDAANSRRNYIITFSGIGFFYILLVGAVFFYQGKKKQAAQMQQQLIEKLTRSNTELERFAYVASHDMQEPLRMISNFSSIIGTQYKDKLDAEGQIFLKLVADSATRMQQMVTDLLEYARIGMEGMQLVKIDGNLELQHVLENLSTATKESGAVITHDALPNITGNPVQFMRLLQNLIGNGLKYQPKGAIPIIHISAEVVEGEWQFSVRDNGIGMKQEYVSQIFEPYKRLHTWDQYTGTGIGLAVCKKIVENHRGRIWAVSEIDKGSVFHFTWPQG